MEPEPQPGLGRSEAAWNRNRSRSKEERCTTYQAGGCTVYREHCHAMPALSVFVKKRCSNGNVRPYHSRHLLCRNRDLYTLHHSVILACRNVVAADAIDVAELACTGFTRCTLAADGCVMWRKRASAEFQALKPCVPQDETMSSIG